MKRILDQSEDSATLVQSYLSLATCNVVSIHQANVVRRFFFFFSTLTQNHYKDVADWQTFQLGPQAMEL